MDTPPRGKCPKLKEVAVILYVYCGISMIKIGRICSVSDVAVLYWIKDVVKNAVPLNPKLQLNSLYTTVNFNDKGFYVHFVAFFISQQQSQHPIAIVY